MTKFIHHSYALITIKKRKKLYLIEDALEVDIIYRRLIVGDGTDRVRSRTFEHLKGVLMEGTHIFYKN